MTFCVLCWRAKSPPTKIDFTIGKTPNVPVLWKDVIGRLTYFLVSAYVGLISKTQRLFLSALSPSSRSCCGSQFFLTANAH